MKQENQNQKQNLLHKLLWVLVLFPWLDLLFRATLPGFVSSLWDEIFIVVILLAVWVYKRHEPRYLAIPRNIQWPFYAFVLFCVGSIVIHVVPIPVAIDASRVVFQSMLFILLTMYTLEDEKRLHQFINALIISSVIIAIYGVIEYAFKIESPRWEHKKDTGTFRIISIMSNPNALAGYLNMILAFTTALVLFIQDRKMKLLYLLACVPLFLALLLTFSRGAWIAFVAMGIFYIWVWNKKWLLSLPVVAAIIPFIFDYLPSAITGRIMALFDPKYYQMSSEYGRISFWTEALIKMKNNPIFGVGMGTFGDSVPHRHNMPFSTWVDNHYLKMGAEIGLLGLIAFLVLLYVLFRQAHLLAKNTTSDREKAYLMGICGVFIVMFVQNVTASIWEALTVAVYFYAFIGIVFALLWKEHKKGSAIK
jgi:O-antigen ligase